MKNIILYTALLIFNLSCWSTSDLKLVDDPNVLKIYTSEEISSLNQIVVFFDDFIMKSTKEQQLNEAYHKYVESICYAGSMDELKKRIGLTINNTKLLINNLKEKGVFYEIWQYEYGLDYKTKDTISQSLIPNISGKHYKLLKLIGQTNEELKEYTNIIKTCGSIPPSLIAGFQNVHSKFDFTKELHRLIWAVHYLTIISEEPYKGKD